MDTDSDADPTTFAIDLQDAKQKTNLKKKILLITLPFISTTFTSFFKDKNPNEVIKH
jgi:hypothetical protein